MGYEGKISVRGLVEFVYQSGDLDTRFTGKSRMTDGIKVHQKIQKSQGDAYEAEVPLSKRVCIDLDREIYLTVSGRADGVLSTPDLQIIDEIKGTSVFLDKIDADTYPVHWAQAKMYGAIYSELHGLDEMGIQLTYADFDSGGVKRIKQVFQATELMNFLHHTINLYKKWLIFKMDWRIKRNSSIENLDFPFGAYRKGQRELAVSVYNTIKNGEILFAQAPTGIGKTMSTLFPALKTMPANFTEKIFYLSAKTIAKTVAEEATIRVRSSSESVFLKQVTLTAKDKICINDDVICNPDKCPYAKGHFDRTLDALWDAVSHEDVYKRTSIEFYARKHQVCPYEFSLDLALFSDVIICDYNYAFDPRVYLRRFFDMPTENFVFLVDEAHNMVDRARNMYSAELSREKINFVKKELTDRDKKLKNALEAVNRALLKVRKNCDETGEWVSETGDDTLDPIVRKRALVMEKWLTENQNVSYYESVLDLYFDFLGFLRISDLYSAGYLTYIKNGHLPQMVYKLFCIHPAENLKRFISNARAVVFFSATLSPMPYYKKMLLGDSNAKALDLPSPFDEANRVILFSKDISVKYKDRDESIENVARYLFQMVNAKRGNYMVFFPSYHYMEKAYTLFEKTYQGDWNILRQERDMTDEGKEAFLSEFDFEENKKPVIGFVVMGGHFSEGIDLKGQSLIGVMVVGVGLPMISFENELIKRYFDTSGGNGFEFAYQFPGINKVMQSSGRVIRSQSDRGVILLVDQRYTSGYYRRLLPKDWGKTFTSLLTFQDQLNSFWNGGPI